MGDYSVLDSVLKQSSQQSEVVASPLGPGGSAEHDILAQNGVVLDHVISPDDCKLIRDAMDLSDEMQHTSALGTRKEYRNNLRECVKNPKLAERLYERILPFIQRTFTVPTDRDECERMGIHYQVGIEGTWEAYGLNEQFRLCKYEPHGHFSPHCDAFYAPLDTERSFLTFMIYLNAQENDDWKETSTGYQGGNTNFLSTSQTLERMEPGVAFHAEKEHILWGLGPREGMTLLFNHHMLHEGGEVLNGCKYIMRSEVMFRQVKTADLTAEQKEGQHLLRLAEAAECEGKHGEAAKLYRKAYKLCPELEQ